MYELSGKPVSYDDLAKTITAVTGKRSDCAACRRCNVYRVLEKMGIPSSLAAGLASTRAAVREGYLDLEDSSLELLLGRPQTSIEEGIKQILNQ